MATEKLRVPAGSVWELAEEQHGVVTRSQLFALGFGPEAIRHRLARGRLHRLMAGVYAVGRPEVTERGRWMVAVLACGPKALLSHRSAAALLDLRKPWSGPIEVVVPPEVVRRPRGIRVYRLAGAGLDRGRHLRVANIPVTGPAAILVDLATCLPTGQLEAAVNEADHHNLIDPETLRREIEAPCRRPGARRLRLLLDRGTHVLTATELERRFLPLAREAGMPPPQTQVQLGGNRVDFCWPELGLVVETDGLRYHRTTFTQSADKRRDNANARSGLMTLRFTHGQVHYEPQYVRSELRIAKRRLQSKLEGKVGP